MKFSRNITLPLDDDIQVGDTVYKANSRKWYIVLDMKAGQECVTCRTLHGGPHGKPYGPMTNIKQVNIKRLTSKKRLTQS